MARRVSRRKEPSREFHTIKEQNKIDSGIFDDKTMILLSKFYNKKVIEKLKYIIARGKEADVYIADAGDSELVRKSKFIIIKFFRVETSSFFKMSDYIIGDTRFSKERLTKNTIVKIWCRKEMGNLRLASQAGIYTPKPYMANGSILAMEFIGNEEGVQAPQLRFAALTDPTRVLETIINQVRTLYRMGLVHADLSEYNILIHKERPYFIDLGQAVVIKHPNAMQFLERDVENVLNYFTKRYLIIKDPDEVMRYVTH
jgi:RIO kinase 1